MTNPIASAKGSNGQVEVHKDVVRITRKGLWAKLVQSFQGDVEIPIQAITSIEFKKPGFLGDGHIRFTYAGSSGRIAAMACDPDMVQFGSGDLSSFEKVRDLVQYRSNQLRQAPRTAQPSANGSELTALMDLHTKGILTDEEFLAKKRKLLGK